MNDCRGFAVQFTVVFGCIMRLYRMKRAIIEDVSRSLKHSFIHERSMKSPCLYTVLPEVFSMPNVLWRWQHLCREASEPSVPVSQFEHSICRVFASISSYYLDSLSYCCCCCCCRYGGLTLILFVEQPQTTAHLDVGFCVHEKLVSQPLAHSTNSALCSQTHSNHFEVLATTKSCETSSYDYMK